MADFERSLCKWDKEEIRKHLPVLAQGALRGRYICRKCARVAEHRSLLCKPEKIKHLIDEPSSG
jgi:hypothetical protein